MKKIYRNDYDKIIAGVCSGIADYFNIDPVVVRLLAIALLLIFNVLTLVFYIAAIFIMPVKRY